MKLNIFLWTWQFSYQMLTYFLSNKFLSDQNTI